MGGQISRRLVTPGNLVQANGTPVLATIVSVAPIYSYFDVQEGAFLQYRLCFQAGPRRQGLALDALRAASWATKKAFRIRAEWIMLTTR